MGTRGLMGFVIDAQEKLTYNHHDSYPDALGLTMLSFARGCVSSDHFGRKAVVDTAILEKVRAIKMVDENKKPTAAQQKKLEGHANMTVSTGKTDEWYVLLRETQGNPEAQLEVGYMIDSAAFAADSLFCEWGYVIDFDDSVFETYVGFVKEDHADGRFAALHTGKSEYRPIRLIGSWPLSALPSNADFIRHCQQHQED